MKLKLLMCALLGCAAIGSQYVWAVGSPKISGTIAVSGAVTDKGCDVAVEGETLSIDLGAIDVAAFGGVAGTTAGAGEVELPLTNCPLLIEGVSVVFDGAPDLVDNSLLGLNGEGAATGVGIAFYEADAMTQIPLHMASELRPKAEGQADMLLRYVAKYKSTASTVVAGDAGAVANFTLLYN